MKGNNIERFAKELFQAQMSKVAIKPITKTDETLTIDDAYAIQLSNVSKMEENGHKISGKKIGLTSEGIQKQMGVNEPDYGHLYDTMDMVGGKINTSNFLQPKIEGELAFVLKEDLYGKEISPEQVLKATDYVVAAFEIVDSRIENWNIKLIDTVADNASSGCYVLGDKKLSINEVDLLNIDMKLYKNGELIETGNSKAVLGNPAIAVAWLANRVGDYGVTLKKGDVILSGAFSAAPKAEKGDVFRAEFTDLGTVAAEFI